MSKQKGIIEYQILSKVLQDKSMDFIERYELGPQYFSTPIKDAQDNPTGSSTKDVYKFIKAHFDQYNNVPDIATVLSNFPDFTVLEVQDSEDYLVKTIKEEYSDFKFDETFNTAAEIFNKQGSAAAWDYIFKQGDKLNGAEIGNIGVDLIHEGAIERLDKWQKALTNPETAMISSGLPELDKAVGGICREEELVVIQARTGNAKTFLMMKMLYEAWLQGENVAIYEPEMSSTILGYRLDSYIDRWSNNSLRQGRQLDRNYENYVNELRKKTNSFWYLKPKDFQGYCTVSKLKAFCKAKNITVLAIDGIKSQYMADQRASKTDRDDQKLGHICTDLLQLSLDLKIPVLAVVQAKRISREEELDNDTVSGSYEIPQIATLMIAMKLRQENNQKIAEMRITKNRNGDDNTVLNYMVDLDKGIWRFESSNSNMIGASQQRASITSSGAGTDEGSIRRQADDIGDDTF